MSLDVRLEAVRPTVVFDSNITHNLGKMAAKAGLYQLLWRPEELNITHAAQLIEPLRVGLALLERDPAYYRQFNPTNGWGTYEKLVEFTREYLAACIENPDAEIHVSR